MNPTRSANRTVTSRRSATGAAGSAASGASPRWRTARAASSPDQAEAAVAAEPRRRAVRARRTRRRRDQPGAAFGAELRARARSPFRRPGSSRAERTHAVLALNRRRQPRRPRDPAPTPRTRPRSGPGRPRRRRPRPGRAGRSPTAPARVRPIVSTAPRYSSDSVMSETVVSSVVSVTGTPVRWRRASGCAATDSTMPACQFDVGHRSSVTPARDQLGAQRRIVDRARPVRDPLRLDRERAADLRPRRPIRRRGP